MRCRRSRPRVMVVTRECSPAVLHPRRCNPPSLPTREGEFTTEARSTLRRKRTRMTQLRVPRVSVLKSESVEAVLPSVLFGSLFLFLCFFVSFLFRSFFPISFSFLFVFFPFLFPCFPCFRGENAFASSCATLGFRNARDLANLRRHRRLVLQRLGGHRLSGTDQEVRAPCGVHGALRRRAGDQHLVLWTHQAGMGQAMVPQGASGESPIPLHGQAQPRFHAFANRGPGKHLSRDHSRDRRGRAARQRRSRIDCRRKHAGRSPRAVPHLLQEHQRQSRPSWRA